MLQLAMSAAHGSFPAREGLDDDHRCTTVRADEGGLQVGYGCRGRLRFGDGDDVQQFARLCEMLPASGIGEQPVVANAVEAAGQNVQQEAAHELIGSECHRLVARLPGGAVVLAAEGDATCIERQQTLVGDRDPVRVAGQIGEHRGGPGERALGVDDPFALAQRREPLRERARVGECGILTEELQPATTMSLVKLF